MQLPTDELNAALSYLVLKIMVADSFYLRLRGLMGRNKLPDNTGMLLVPCNSVHMCFMNFSIDVIYLDKDFTVLRIVKNLSPWTGLSICRKAWAALELNAGEAERFEFKNREQLIFENGD